MVDAPFATTTEDEHLIDVQLVTPGDTQPSPPGISPRRQGLSRDRSAPDVNPLSLGQAASAQSSTGPSTAATASKSSTGTRTPKVGASAVSQTKPRAKITKKSQPSHASASKPSANNSLRRSERSHTTTPSGRLLMSIGSIIEEEGEDSDDEEDDDNDEDYGSKTSAAGSKRSRKSKNAPNWPSVGRPMHEPVIIQHLFAKIPPSMHVLRLKPQRS
ncbi:hypothetical protein ONZ45_g4310 [Pleurotus djamor]|nr:hypothetical protein ONZ45_g4310 [Pleurotus djamor]